ncbi:M23 family metallopeptidase [Campylobacter concisus]|uniref:M23 family metallopeptidase n=3 Tax=Campylobacter concisus TaxID=199 RepID=UPI0021CC74AF|nr:M23 family metallopeptidase [Campylobacter concisus]
MLSINLVMIFTKVYRTIIINSQTKHKNGKEHKEDVTHLEFIQKDEERSNNTTSKCEGLFKPFAGKLNSLLSSETSKKFETENIYCVNLTSSSTSNASRINKLLKRREEELYKQEDMLILCPIKTATPIRIFQPKKSNFTIVLASQSEFDCSELNPKELNPSRPNYGKLNLCELILTDFKFDTYEKENNGASSDRDIKFKNAKTKSDSVILYKENDDGKDDKNKTKGACFTSIRQSSDEIEYKLEDGVVKMSHFKLPSSKDEYLNFNLLNFAKENNFTLRDDKDSSMFDMKLRLAIGNNVVPTSTSGSSLALTLNNLIIENEKGEASDIDKIYLHHCGDKNIYESTSLVKNKDSDMKNSYRATFNIPIDRNDKKDTKLIVYSSDLSKIYDTKSIHAYTGTAIISIGYKDKSGASFSYTNKVSLRDITDHIVNVVSDNEYPFKTNEEISLKAIYKQEKGSKKYKEVLWGYMVIKTIEYNELSKKQPREAVALKDQKGKEIRFKISDLIKKDDLDKLKQGGHTIVFFAYLEGESDKFKYQSVYGKNHIRIDIKIPLYIKFKDDKLIIYEFEHAIKEKSFKASLNHDDALVNKSGYLYIDKDISKQDINIYEDDKLTKELKSEDSTNKRYQIYIDEANSSNYQNQSNTNQAGQTKINQDTKYGINLLSKDNMNSFINSFNESKSITRVDKGMWVDGDREALVKIEIGNEIVFPLKIKPLNDKGMKYDWTLMLGDTGESQAIFNWDRLGGRKHAARDLYTNRIAKTNANELAFTSNVEIVSIADGEVIQTGPFYYKTNHITIQYDTVEFGSFIIRYGEVDPSRVKVKVGDKVRKGQVIGYAGFMIDNGKHPEIIKNEIVTMLHFEYFTNGANTKDAFTVKNDPNNKFKRRKDLADPLEILKEGYKNTFGETL